MEHYEEGVMQKDNWNSAEEVTLNDHGSALSWTNQRNRDKREKELVMGR
jgi:hypothetical protein